MFTEAKQYKNDYSCHRICERNITFWNISHFRVIFGAALWLWKGSEWGELVWMVYRPLQRLFFLAVWVSGSRERRWDSFKALRLFPALKETLSSCPLINLSRGQTSFIHTHLGRPELESYRRKMRFEVGCEEWKGKSRSRKESRLSRSELWTSQEAVAVAVSAAKMCWVL